MCGGAWNWFGGWAGARSIPFMIIVDTCRIVEGGASGDQSFAQATYIILGGGATRVEEAWSNILRKCAFYSLIKNFGFGLSYGIDTL